MLPDGRTDLAGGLKEVDADEDIQRGMVSRGQPFFDGIRDENAHIPDGSRENWQRQIGRGADGLHARFIFLIQAKGIVARDAHAIEAAVAVRLKERIAAGLAHLPRLLCPVRQKCDMIAGVHPEDIRQIAFGNFARADNDQLFFCVPHVFLPCGSLVGDIERIHARELVILADDELL